MTREEVDEFLSAERTCRVATITAAGRPHVSPLWFLWDGEAIWLHSIVRSQRFTDVARNPRVAVVIDTGDTFDQLRGVEITGAAEVVGDIPRSPSHVDDALARAESLFARKFLGQDQFSSDGRHAWLRVRADKIASWDYRKLRRS